MPAMSTTVRTMYSGTTLTVHARMSHQPRRALCSGLLLVSQRANSSNRNCSREFVR